MGIQVAVKSLLECEQSDDSENLAELASAEAMITALGAQASTVARRRGELEKAAEAQEENSVPLGKLQDMILELRNEGVNIRSREQRWTAAAGVIRDFLGSVVGMAKKNPATVEAQKKALVKKLLLASDGARDEAEAAHTKSEAMPAREDFDAGPIGEADYRRKCDVIAYRATALGRVQPAAHYSTVLHATKVKHGERIARMLQTAMWHSERLPMGEGYL